MKFLDFFKKKKKEEVKKEVKPAKIEEEAKELPKVSVSKPKVKRIDLAWKVLKTPHISEKATDLIQENKYTFRVLPMANKLEIKRAIEDIYGVDVLGVNIIKIPRKKRRLGRISGWRKGYKKAIVKVKEGQKIEILPR